MTPPVVTFATSTSQAPGVIDLSGGVTDDISGVDRVRVYVRNIQTGEYWNGSTFTSTWTWNVATLNGNDTWTLPNVDLTTPGTYQVLHWAWDNDDNLSSWQDNPQPTITVN